MPWASAFPNIQLPAFVWAKISWVGTAAQSDHNTSVFLLFIPKGKGVCQGNKCGHLSNFTNLTLNKFLLKYTRFGAKMQFMPIPLPKPNKWVSLNNFTPSTGTFWYKNDKDKLALTHIQMYFKSSFDSKYYLHGDFSSGSLENIRSLKGNHQFQKINVPKG
jgi:hypothetical protein